MRNHLWDDENTDSQDENHPRRVAGIRDFKRPVEPMFQSERELNDTPLIKTNHNEGDYHSQHNQFIYSHYNTNRGKAATATNLL